MSEMKGAAREIRSKAQFASLCPCNNHSLNLSLSKSHKLNTVKKAIGVIKQVI